jgi:hypothetical protein
VTEPIDPNELGSPAREPFEQAMANWGKFMLWLIGGVIVFTVIGVAAHAPAVVWGVVGGVGALIAVGLRLFKDIPPIITERKRREQAR